MRVVRRIGVAVVAVALVAGGAAVGSAAVTGPLEPAAPVLPPLSDAASAPTPPPDAPTVADLVDPYLDSGLAGSSIGAVIFDAGTGALLYSRDSLTPRTPASTTKILTSLAALDALGPETRLTTTVTWTPSTATLTLVGAGDPTLSSTAGEGSSLVDLAEQVAANLDVDTVALRYDTSLFDGPSLGPGWSPDYPALGIAAPITALMVDGARIPDSISLQEDPAQAAAEVFAALLAERGITTDTPQPGSSGGGVIARTESVRLADIVDTVLTESDNTASEMIGHLAGAARTGSGSFASGADAAVATLANLGVATTGVTIADGSGLSAQNALPARTLGQVLTVLSRSDAPGWAWPVMPGLPIAGFTGTLAERFTDADAQAAIGVVRAKTGTLFGVSTLAGTLVDADGRLLTFALLADATGDVTAARATLDAAIAQVVSCGCRVR